MKIKTLSAIVACSGLLLIQGLDSTSLYKNVTVNPNHRIINGEPANPADFRFLVLLAIKVGILTGRCGGSVISNHFILTTAHCLYNNVCNDIQIYPSTWVPGDPSDLRPIDCWPHEGFVGHEYFNDIGIVKLKEDLLADSRFAKINLPPPGMIYGPDDMGIIAGWGVLEDGSTATHLMRAELAVSSWDYCTYVYGVAENCADNMICPVPRLPDSVFCTLGKPPKFPGSCFGDSGGPVIINGMLAGVMSGIILSDTRQCIPGTPGLNQDVSEFIPWILDHIESDRDTNHISVADKYS